jgi:spore coat protein U-like protein
MFVYRVKFIATGLCLATALAFSVSPVPAMAATSASTFQVSASVTATCQISATNLAFGAYAGTVANATSTVTITCTNTTPYNVGLDPGTSTGATVTTRKMTGPGGAVLAYSLSRDSAHTLNWGNTVGTDTESGSGNGSAQALTVYGQVAANQFVAPGNYTDTISATVTF